MKFMNHKGTLLKIDIRKHITDIVNLIETSIKHYVKCILDKYYLISINLKTSFTD